MVEFNYMGKRGLRRVDGYEKVSGKAIYTSDVQFTGMLYAKSLLLPYAHARIKSMDTSKAEALPGVRAILRYDDPEIEGEKKGAATLLSDIADFEGQPMGVAVCAESEEIVDEALKLVEIEWEELPFYVDWDEAAKPDATPLRPDLNPDTNRAGGRVAEYGDIEAGLEEADHIIEWQNYCEEDTWGGVEPLHSVARWIGDDYLETWHKGQTPEGIQILLSEHGQQPMAKIHVHAPYSGATFGGLAWLPYTHLFNRIPAIFAKRTGRPVKALFDHSCFYGCGWTRGTYNFKVGVKDDGTITAIDVDNIFTNADINKLRHDTKVQNFRANTFVPYLSRGPHICYRHGARACIIHQQVFEHVAGELGLDPTEVALLNDGCEGIAMADMADIKGEQGFDPTRDSLKECIEAGKAAIDWDNKWHAPGTKQLPNGKMHGLSFMHVYEWNYQPATKCTSAVQLNHDGTVNILGRFSDIGVSPATTYCQIVADEMGMRYEDVICRQFDDVGWDMRAPSGSSGLVNNFSSLIDSARKAKEGILEMCMKGIPGYRLHGRIVGGVDPPFGDLTPDELDVKDSVIFEKANPENKTTVVEVVTNLRHGGIAEGVHAVEPVFAWGWNPGVDDGHKYAMCRQAHFMEVEVDTETGLVEVTNMVVVNDVGKAINPDSCNGQQYGGAGMGIGRSNTEAVYYDPQTGVQLNPNLIGYPLTTILDYGPIECILVETGLGYGPYGTCGIGEDLGAAVCTLTAPAIYNALGIYVDDYPTTPDKVLKALGKA